MLECHGFKIVVTKSAKNLMGVVTYLFPLPLRNYFGILNYAVSIARIMYVRDTCKQGVYTWRSKASVAVGSDY